MPPPTRGHQCDEFETYPMIDPEPEDGCPVCEFERGAPGRPFPRGDAFTCLDCGNIWKSIGSMQVFQPETAKSEEDCPLQYALRKQSVSQSASMMKASARQSYRSFSSLLVAMVAGVGAIFVLLSSNSYNVRKIDQLAISELRFEELIRQSGKVVRVTGRISNETDTSHSIPRMEIVLKKSVDQDLAKWHYQTGSENLEPGETRLFSSSVPIRSAFISSVEARFE